MSEIDITAASSFSHSPSNFQSVFNVALETYERTTKNKLLTHPLATQLQSCDSPAAVLTALRDLVQQFEKNGGGDERLRRWLDPTVNVLFAFSATLSEGIGLVFSPAKVIFAGFGVLLQAAKDFNARQDVLADLFSRIERFFKRLELYTEVFPTAAMTDIIVEIMVEVLVILAIATREVKENRSKMFVKKLLGKNDVEEALKRLDTLTQEEARMATVEVLKVTLKVDNNVMALIDGGKEAKASNVDKEKWNQIQEKLHTWLSPPDPSTNHNIARKIHHEGTSTWFFEGGMYQEWKSSPSLLWIHGKPGSGKSVLCSGIIEDIMAQREEGSATMVYFYCDFRDGDKRKCRKLLLSILSQLGAQSDLCCDLLQRNYAAHNRKGEPSDRTLTKCLTEALSLIVQHPVYLIVDALDECPNNSGMPTPREEVLELVADLIGLELPNLHICVTSRPEIDIQTTLKPLTSLRVSLHKQMGQKKDIANYVSSIVSSDAKMRRWREEDRKLVIETLTERADGMFRWVYCQLEALRHCLPASVRGVLDELPETLDETYERVLKEINKANREHARRLLHCLAVAIRPLRVEDLAEVLAGDFDAARQGGVPKFNPDWRWADQRQAVLSTCSSLIAIVNDGHFKVVQFSHFSVKEFLTSDRLARSSEDVSWYHIPLEPAHTLLAQVCLGVLFRLDDSLDRRSIFRIPLARYAARYWAEHAQFENVSSCIWEAMQTFFDADKLHWTAWHQVPNIDVYLDSFSDIHADVAGPLYYAALCGFYDLVKYLVGKYPGHINARGGMLATPLVAALHGEHFQVAEFLFRHGAEVDVRGTLGNTPLISACWIGPMDVLQWLLDHGADPNAHTELYCTSLQNAAFSGRLKATQALLEHGADISARNAWGEVALHLAACNVSKDHRNLLAIMQLLLESGADVNARNDVGLTPLHHSSCRELRTKLWCDRRIYAGPCHNGTLEGSKLLLEHGADIDARDDEGRTPLDVALEHGRDEIARFLLEYGATRPC